MLIRSALLPMAGSRAPHPLAEAIAELAAPPVAESFLFIHPEDSFRALLLHLRPRRLAAGLEASVRCGRLFDLEGQPKCELHRSGPVFAVSSVPLACGARQHAELAADIDGFVAELVEASWTYRIDFGVCLQLPERASELSGSYARSWQRVELLLLPTAALGAAPLAGDHISLRLPAIDDPVLCASFVDGRSVAYARRQAAVREERRRRSSLLEAVEWGNAEALVELATLPDQGANYDDDAAMEARYAQLRSDDMRRLAAALANILKLACRFRGVANTPTVVQPVAAADGAAGPGGSQ